MRIHSNSSNDNWKYSMTKESFKLWLLFNKEFTFLLCHHVREIFIISIFEFLKISFLKLQLVKIFNYLQNTHMYNSIFHYVIHMAKAHVLILRSNPRTFLQQKQENVFNVLCILKKKK